MKTVKAIKYITLNISHFYTPGPFSAFRLGRMQLCSWFKNKVLVINYWVWRAVHKGGSAWTLAIFDT